MAAFLFANVVIFYSFVLWAPDVMSYEVYKCESIILIDV